ncbi:hypothetical protein PUR28_35110 [Streptomyces sp. BE308]|uniref:hypothetical protein n=1 Tax=unclassified Streptomyces TaxID=2593676 RepID=UPI002DD8A22C|nr:MULTISPECIES: hypothetical protein [unclassified Streptomyces]MEE1795950.1 hypothetical protein [Streptomyces sp. BE308]WRZ76039.1 hypothetical protein OG251_32895 [Streptomyces sp. NBC_01237]
MTRHRMAARTAAGAAVVALTLTSGAVAHADDDIGSLSAQQIADRSRDALLGVHSLHLNTRGDLGRADSPMTLDLVLDRDGNCAGGVDLGDDEGSLKIVKRGDTVWLKPDSAFWKNQVPIGGSAFEAIVAGRYIKASATDPRLGDVTRACDLDTFRRLISDNAKTGSDRGTLVKGKETRLAGSPVIPLIRTRNGDTLTWYVATEGKPYPVRLTVKGPSADAVVGFSAFDKPVPTATPPADETVDVNALLGRTTSPV